MNEEILKELTEINLHLKNLRADIQKLASLLERMGTQKSPSSATAFQKRS